MGRELPLARQGQGADLPSTSVIREKGCRRSGGQNGGVERQPASKVVPGDHPKPLRPRCHVMSSAARAAAEAGAVVGCGRRSGFTLWQPAMGWLLWNATRLLAALAIAFMGSLLTFFVWLAFDADLAWLAILLLAVALLLLVSAIRHRAPPFDIRR
jgi:hypothetical protein